MSHRPSSRCSTLLRRSHATSCLWRVMRCAALLLCLHPANERNGNLMKLFRLSSFHPTAVGSALSTPRAMTPTCGSAHRSSARGRSPRSPRRPQACVASSNSAGPPNAWQGRPSRPSKSRRPCSSRFPATRAAWASTSPITCASRSVKPRVRCMTKLLLRRYPHTEQYRQHGRHP